ncbi:hypothetical protein ACO0QE_000072 [Hanseniaspora vineae]
MSSRLGTLRQYLTSRNILVTATLGTLLSTTYLYTNHTKREKREINTSPDISITKTYNRLQKNKEKPPLPSRQDLLQKLSNDTQNDIINDVLIIGGGATGTASAIDAITRDPKLRVVLVEMNDFSSGTSSKSTKLIHGGVRYLEKAVFQLSKSQLDLVIEALNERQHMISTAPHLCKVLPIMIPAYNVWQVPYYYVGAKLYDIFSGWSNLKNSYLLLGSRSVLDICPMLEKDGLKGGIVYHDGSFNDSRMNVSLATTAVEKGATILNYMEVLQLLKNGETGRVEGCIAQDKETGKTYQIKSKTTVNATGPFSDRILQMDHNIDGFPGDRDLLQEANKNIPQEQTKQNSSQIENQVAVANPQMVIPSSGVHLILPSYYCPSNMGLLDAQTSDGRVMFFLPWQDKVIAGTTDVPLKTVPQNPTATEVDIQDILKELQHYIKFPVRREDVLSAWCGVRPLAKDPRVSNVTDPGTSGSSAKAKTEGLVRSHFLFTSDTGLITIAAGKWTTAYSMAKDTIDEVMKHLHGENGAHKKPCMTGSLKLTGAEDYSPNVAVLLSQDYGISTQLATHLAENYGTNASVICEIFKKDPRQALPLQFGDPKLTLEDVNFKTFEYPYTIAELQYAMDYEYARTPLDFLLRRTRFGFLDTKNALNAVKGTVEVMGERFKWDTEFKERQLEYTREYLKTFNYHTN